MEAMPFSENQNTYFGGDARKIDGWW